MKITDIKPNERHKDLFGIYADGKFLMTVPANVLAYLQIGSEIDEDEISGLSHAALVNRAKERLLYSLDRRLHSRYELEQKLFGTYPPDIIADAIAELEMLGLVDDLKFARAFAEELVTLRNKGKLAVKSELFKKGVSKDIINTVIDELFEDENAELAAALAAAEKFRGRLYDKKEKQKAYNFLLRRGFGYGIAEQALRCICDEEFFED